MHLTHVAYLLPSSYASSKILIYLFLAEKVSRLSTTETQSNLPSGSHRLGCWKTSQSLQEQSLARLLRRAVWVPDSLYIDAHRFVKHTVPFSHD